jgi:hypothetical protein
MIWLKKYKIKSISKKLKAMQQYRLLNQPKDEVIAKEIKLYWNLSEIYQKLIGNKKFPFAEQMVQESLRAAASLDDTAAQFDLANQLIEEAKFRDQLEAEKIFSSPGNQRQIKQLYEEAHAYLQAAKKAGSAKAKRLQGICYIHGWGLEQNRDKGFELVIASIEQENCWDKIPEIFASIANKDPELFSALMKYRSQS